MACLNQGPYQLRLNPLNLIYQSRHTISRNKSCLVENITNLSVTNLNWYSRAEHRTKFGLLPIGIKSTLYTKG